MTKIAGRIGAIFIALLFLVTTVGFTFMVVWQSREQDKKNQQQVELQKALQSQTQNQAQDNINKEDKVEGTQLQNYTPVSLVASLQKIDTVEGKGAEVKESDTVTVHYTGAVAATGKVFQSSLDTGQPVAFPLNQVIKGWTEGIPGMKAGGTRRLIIPAELAYGANPPAGSGIPANADLVFDVQLVKIGE